MSMRVTCAPRAGQDPGYDRITRLEPYGLRFRSPLDEPGQTAARVAPLLRDEAYVAWCVRPAQRRQECLADLARALRDDLDPAVVEVRRAARETELQGLR